MKLFYKNFFQIILFLPFLVSFIPQKSEQDALKIKELFPDPIFKINDSTINELFENKIYVDSIVKDFQEKNNLNTQELKILILAMHENSCNKSFHKITMLEKYSLLLNSFIKESYYIKEKKMLTLILDHSVLPYSMRLNIIVDYPKSIKDYPFYIPDGPFKGLTGVIKTNFLSKNCLYSINASWKGPKKFNNLLLELISETLAKIGVSVMLRKTR